MIKYSAILFYLKNDPNPIVFTGLRHADILESMFKLRLDYNKDTMIQGFLTDDYKFLNRYEAKKEAEKNNQLINPSSLAELFSEDIWP